MRNWLLMIIGLLILISFRPVLAAGLCSGAPKEYVMDSIKGKVVDEETGAPIEGVIVVAFWQTIQPYAFMKIQESATDIMGEFFFPGWGPLKRPKDGCFYGDDPTFKVFNPGYKTWGHRNSYYSERTGSPEQTLVNPVSSRIRKSRYNGTEIKIKKFVIGAEERHTLLSSGETVSHVLTEKDWCENIHLVFRGFDGIDDIPSSLLKFSLPKLIKTMSGQKELYPNCFSGEGLDRFEKK